MTEPTDDTEPLDLAPRGNDNPLDACALEALELVRGGIDETEVSEWLAPW